MSSRRLDIVPSPDNRKMSAAINTEMRRMSGRIDALEKSNAWLIAANKMLTTRITKLENK